MTAPAPHAPWVVVTAVAAGGAIGAVARLLLSLGLQRTGATGPVPTLVVNVLGCLAFGVCWAGGGTAWSRPVAAAVFVGFLGAFTTFSTFAFDVTQLWAEERASAAILLVLGHNVLGMFAMLLGLWLGRTLLAR